MTIDKQALLGPDKHSNQHKLSRLIAEANSAEIRDIAEAVEQYTDQLIAALEAAEKRIAEQREYYEGVISDGSKRIAELEAKLSKPVLLPKTNGYWTEQEKAYEEAITFAKRQVRLAGFNVEEM
ncbi:ead/Ea22-like family protein [Salmonella enterica]|nr:ead/Ea22-like family protein [Salmonella enterica subsp. arizonae serovar 53:z4,z23,z32:-]EHJ9659362.1 ead/Ea22-like family protein [Salmonella enterica]EHQ8348050.1 ead/Ea22-like family protein [Salmonella enterica]